MKALQIVAPGQFEITDQPIPVPGPGQILLKVLAVTTCPHWDIHIWRGEPMLSGWELKYPYTLGQPGHEACGEVVAVGEGVAQAVLGQRVCTWIDAGQQFNGCYAQYVAKDVNHVVEVPKDLPPESCAALELAACASGYLLYVLQLNAIRDKRVGVFGLGPAGLVFLQLALAEGAKEVVGFDLMPKRRELAKRLGAAEVLDPNSEEGKEFPWFYKPGCLDTSFDCVGIPAVVQRALEVTKNVVSLFAVQREPYIYQPNCWCRTTLTSDRLFDRKAGEYAAKRLAEGKLDLSCLVTHKMTLEEYPRAVELLSKQEAIKVAFFPQES